MKDTFCSHCGTAFDAVNYPKSCIQCGQTAWDNPIPVVVCVQPLFKGNSFGLAGGIRAIEPHHGRWALIGGHIENGESAEQAAIREFREETGMPLGNNLRTVGTYANGKGHILIAVQADPQPLERMERNWVCCPENSALGAVYDPETLCFPIHQMIYHHWQNALKLGRAA